jgi:hypothetical protein
MRCLRNVSLALAVLQASACGGDDSPAGPSSTQARWSGAWTLNSCVNASGSLCDGVTALGSTIQITYTQTVSNIQGSAQMGSLSLTINGSISGTGAMTLTGQGTLLGATVTITAWQVTITGTSMAGTFTLSVVGPGGTGTSTVTGTLTNVIRTS